MLPGANLTFSGQKQKEQKSQAGQFVNQGYALAPLPWAQVGMAATVFLQEVFQGTGNQDGERDI
jgi:hypothetical protein